MWYHVIGYTFSVSKFFWIISARVLKNSIDTKKNVINGRITMHIPLYILIYPMIDKAHSYVSTIRRFSFHHFFPYFWIRVSKISTISTIRIKIEPSISNDMWPRVFISEFGSKFPCFLVKYLAYILYLLVCGNFLLTLNTVKFWNPL